MKTTLLPSLKWDIKVQPLRTITGISTPRKAIMRNDNNGMLGYLSDKYVPFTNSQLIKLCGLIEKTGNFRTEGYSTFRDGKVVMAFLRNNSRNLGMNGYKVREYLVIGNSHDGSKNLFVGSSQHLVRCENQFTSANPVFRHRHVGRILVNADFAEMLKKEYEKERLSIYNTMEGLRKRPVNQAVIDQLLKSLFPTDRSITKADFQKEFKSLSPAELLLKSIRKEIKELGSNAFGLFNGVTWFTSHEMPRNDNNFGNAYGSANHINHRALQFCMEI
jgi:hypothetical protein